MLSEEKFQGELESQTTSAIGKMRDTGLSVGKAVLNPLVSEIPHDRLRVYCTGLRRTRYSKVYSRDAEPQLVGFQEYAAQLQSSVKLHLDIDRDILLADACDIVQTAMDSLKVKAMVSEPPVESTRSLT